MRKKIVAGNWKMNKTLPQGLALVDEIVSTECGKDVLKIIAAPFIHTALISAKLKGMSGFATAAQDCHQAQSGAYTGEVSAEMIASAGAQYVIIGHSERRNYNKETPAVLQQKLNMALAAGLVPIFCIGENLDERNANRHLEAVRLQLKESLFNLPATDIAKIIIAYEPVWAIGTGLNATSHQAQGMHHFIRTELNKKYGKDISENSCILYGGSCNPQNARELFACLDVDGGLIGGASLKAADFAAICNSF